MSRAPLNTSPDLFVDTGGWLCMIDETHKDYAEAWAHYRNAHEHHGQVVTTRYVIVEFVPLVTQRAPGVTRAGLCRFVDEIIVGQNEVIPVDDDLYLRAWNMLKKYLDKKWSLVDAVSFLVMADRQILNALATDHHFDQAGKIRLLPS